MAFSTKVDFIPFNEQESPITFDNIDYGLIPINARFIDLKENLLETFKPLNFKEIHDYYTDFVLELSFDEFLEFHGNHHNYSSLDQPYNSFILKNRRSRTYQKAIITVFEWEGGY